MKCLRSKKRKSALLFSSFIYTCVYINIIEMIHPKPQIFNLAAFDTYIYIHTYILYIYIHTHTHTKP